MTEIDISQHVFKYPGLTSIVSNAIEFFESTPVAEFPPQTRLAKCGVYAIYYCGKFELYGKLGAANERACNFPIYVGKAVPSGYRTARSIEAGKNNLGGRLNQHSRSIERTANLFVSDFKCRFMILDGAETDLIVPVEATLIRKYLPIWNHVIAGFGIHDPGGNRDKQKTSEWDSLHPGRAFLGRMVGTSHNPDEVAAKVKNHLDKLTLS